ncbi:hypothetical protein [Paraburkholderia fungorum]|uniref:hypothetical protein n=1 Tax=Paraburkholderia fungorum TaxID=134537 RepID=UPI002091F332|nr:hypothetical protein [Paraburkholderia fungorum]USU19844.1 hypothetical protein NFE55_37810 [Paraburkholderia fungorum]USU28159.1 hypothetical protein NFS19_23760 [Paraburkholderia fungorum]
MTTNITITKDTGADAARNNALHPPARRLPGWLWFIALWCFGVGSAVSLGFAFKLLMNATLFAVK